MALANHKETVGTEPDKGRKDSGLSLSYSPQGLAPTVPGQGVIPTAPAQKRLSLTLLILGVLSLVGVMISIWMIFFYTPVDALQGEPQRILYIHVPTAWGGMLGFVVLAVAGIIYLFRPDERLDWIARASAEIACLTATRRC